MNKLLHILYESITDVTQRVDGKLLTIAAVAAIVVLTFPVGWIWGRWPPEYIWAPTLLFLAAGLGIDAYTTAAKINADAPRPPAPGPQVTVEKAETINAGTDAS